MQKDQILISIPSYYNSIYLPYIWGLLRAEAEKDENLCDQYEWLKPIFRFGEPAKLASPYQFSQISVLGLSCYDWNWEIQCELARLAKQENPNILVVMGGPEPDYTNPEFFKKHPYVDIVAIQDGEITFANILKEKICENPDYSKVQGIVYSKNGNIFETGPTNKPDLTISESPYLKYPEFIEWTKEIKLEQKVKAFWETNRGCPYQCTFCDWGSNSYTKLRFVDKDRLKKEATWFGKNKIDSIFLSDANFGMFRSDLETTNLLGEVRIEYNYPKEVHWLPAKNNVDRVFEISKAMHDNKFLHALIVGFQSTDPHVLELMNRKNISNDKFVELTNKCNEHKIPTVGVLIMGCPGETLQSFQKSLHDLIELGFHNEIRTHMYSVLPNAPAADKSYLKDNQIKYIDRPMIQQRCLKKDASMPHAGRSKFIIEHKMMSTSEWVDSFLYSTMIFLFHNFGLTRYLSQYSHNALQVSYGQFYRALFDDLKNGRMPSLGSKLKELENHIYKFIDDEGANVLFDLGIDNKLYEPEEFLLYHALKDFHSTRSELNDFWIRILANHSIELTETLEDLFDYQFNLIINEDFQRTQSKTFTQIYDWQSIFNGKGIEPNLENDPDKVFLYSALDSKTGVGITEQPLEWNSFTSYFLRIVGHRYYRSNNLFHEKIEISTICNEAELISPSYANDETFNNAKNLQ